MPPAYESADVPAWPVYSLTVHEDGRVVAHGPLVPETRHPSRAGAIGTVAAAAARLDRPVRARATEPDGTVWHLAVSPDGAVEELPGGGRQRDRPSRRRGDRTSGPAAERAGSAGPAPESPADARGHGPAPDPRPAPDAYADSLAQVTAHLKAGRVAQAVELTARLDEQAADTLGVSHPDALGVREVRARVAVLAGDASGGVRLFRDVAERWHYQGDGERAEAAAARAETVWLQITDLDEALAAGIGVVRLRNQLPGPDGSALTAVLEHQAWLAGARGTAPAPGRVRRPTPSWERPAQDVRAAR
ncbi:hypothetical protein [Streptomyces sp. NPDC006997]|uniref:hypothetical protein n=1 Tax=Streptomyces sp. NPDC006997 TaxID=3155356 RepID=UPI0033C858A6